MHSLKGSCVLPSLDRCSLIVSQAISSDTFSISFAVGKPRERGAKAKSGTKQRAMNQGDIVCICMIIQSEDCYFFARSSFNAFARENEFYMRYRVSHAGDGAEYLDRESGA